MSQAIPLAPQPNVRILEPPVLACGGCGKPLRGRQKVACSDPCRAKANRRRLADALAAGERKVPERDQRVRGLLEAAMNLVGARGGNGE